jgi:voltage-gated potassium channel Kch
VTALVETPTGVMLLLSPPLVARLLLGAPLDAPAAVIVGRVAGAALLALGGGCWLARDDGSSLAVRGLIAMLLLYNCATGAVLADAGARLGIAGALMWPAVAIHALLAVWCVASLRSGPMNAPRDKVGFNRD